MRQTLLLLIVSITLESCVGNWSCPYWNPKNVKLRVSYFKEGIDTAKVAFYVDTFYKVKMPYPSNFKVNKSSCSPGLAEFRCYKSGFSTELCLNITRNYNKWDVGTAIDEYLSNSSDSTLMCLTRGKDFFALGYPDGKIRMKCVLINDKWITLSLYPGGYVRDAVGSVEDFLNNWYPEELSEDYQKGD